MKATGEIIWRAISVSGSLFACALAILALAFGKTDSWGALIQQLVVLLVGCWFIVWHSIHLVHAIFRQSIKESTQEAA